jgi:hypothetical protein
LSEVSIRLKAFQCQYQHLLEFFDLNSGLAELSRMLDLCVGRVALDKSEGPVSTFPSNILGYEENYLELIAIARMIATAKMSNMAAMK